MTYTASILLMMGGQGGQEGGSPYSSLIFLGLIIVVFYFFMIRPQVKKQKQLRKYREELKKGDSVVTTGGIYGQVVEIKDNAIIIEIDKEVKIKVDKNAIISNPADLANKK